MEQEKRGIAHAITLWRLLESIAMADDQMSEAGLTIGQEKFGGRQQVAHFTSVARKLVERASSASASAA